MKALKTMKKTICLVAAIFLSIHFIWAQELDLAVPLKNELVYKSLEDLYANTSHFDVPIIRGSDDVDLHFSIQARLFYLTVDAQDDYPLLNTSNLANASNITFWQEVSVPYKLIISGLDDQEQSVDIAKFGTLKVSPNKDLAADIYFANEGEADDLDLHDITNVRLEIEAANLPTIGVYDQSLRQKLIMEVYIEYPRYDKSTHTYQTDFEVNSASYPDLQENEVMIHWDHPNQLDGVGYELEWVHMPSSANMIQNGAIIQRYVDWAKATRIQTKNTHYVINVIHEEGYIVSRVRTVRYQLNDAESDIIDQLEYGEWSINDAFNPIPVVAYPHHPQALSINDAAYTPNIIIDDFDNYNWQYKAVYANEGKKKESISFFDGSNYNRQSLAISATDEARSVGSAINKNNLIAQENYYDFNGQAILQILPTPLIFNGVKYREDINQFNNAKITKGQLDNENDANYFPQALDINSAGAAQYYSDQNPFYDPLNQDENWFLPDAEGYPYSRTVFMNDGSGRIKESYGIGDRLANDDDATENTRFFYSKPTQPELELLFGTNVGDAKFYKKNVTIDGNGVMSMAYIDQKDRTIATSMAGQAKAESQMGPEPASRSMEVDLLANGNVVYDDIERSYSISQPLFVAESGNYTFTYTLDVSKFLSCFNPVNQLCFECPYDYVFQIVDEEGVLITEATIDAPIVANCDAQNYTIYSVTNKDAPRHSDPTLDAANSKMIIPLLAPKNYTVIQSIKLNTSNIEGAKDNYLQDPNCNNKTLEEFISDELDVADFESCRTDFEDPCSFVRDSLREDFRYPGGAFVADVSESDDLIKTIMARTRRVDRILQTSLAFPLDPMNPTAQEQAELDYWESIRVRFEGIYGIANPTFADYSEEHYDFFLDYHPSYCKLYTCEELMNPESLEFDRILEESESSTDFINDIRNMPGVSSLADITFNSSSHDVTTSDIFLDLDASISFNTEFTGSLVKVDIGNNVWKSDLSKDLALIAFDVGFTDAILNSRAYPNSDPAAAGVIKNLGILEKQNYPASKECYFVAKPGNWYYTHNWDDHQWGGGSYKSYVDYMYLLFKYFTEYNNCTADPPPAAPNQTGEKGIAYMAYYAAEACTGCSTADKEAKRWQLYKDAYASAKRSYIIDFINYSSCAARDANSTEYTSGKFYYANPGIGTTINNPGSKSTEGDSWHWTVYYDWGDWWANGSEYDVYVGSDPDDEPDNGMTNATAQDHANLFQTQTNNKLKIEEELRDLMAATWSSTCSTKFFNNLPGGFDYYQLLQDDAFDIMNQHFGVDANCSVYDLNIAAVLTPYRQNTDVPGTEINNVPGTGTPYLDKVNPLRTNCYDLNDAYVSFSGLTHSHPVANTALTVPSLPNAFADISINNADQRRYVNFMNFQLGLNANMDDYLEMEYSCQVLTSSPYTTNSNHGFTISWADYTAKERSLKAAMYSLLSFNGPTYYWTEVPTADHTDLVAVSDQLLVEMESHGGSTPAERAEDYLGFGQIDYDNSHQHLFFLDDQQTHFTEVLGNFNTILNALKPELRSDQNGVLNYPDFEEAFFATAKIIQNVSHDVTSTSYNLTVNGVSETVKIERAFLYSNGTIMVRLLDMNDDHFDDYYYHYKPHNGHHQLSDITNASFGDFDDIAPVFTGTEVNYIQLQQGTSSTFLLASTTNTIATASDLGRAEMNALAGAPTFPLIQGCEDLKYENAVFEANYKYQEYFENLGTTFKNDYLAFCTQQAPQQQLKLEYESYERHFTLYHYDQADNLVATVPPEGISTDFQRIEANGNTTTGLTYDAALKDDMNDYRLGLNSDRIVPEHSLQTTYQYNADNQIIKQITPNGGTTYFWYDKEGRLVLSQNEEQYNTSKFSYTLYDGQSRISETGEIIISVSAVAPFAVSRDEVWDHFNYTLLHDKKFTPMQEPLVFVSDVIEVSGLRTDVIKTYYDAAILTANVADFTQENLRSRVASQAYYTSYSPIAVVEEWEYSTHYSYDPVGNVKTVLQDYLQIDRLTDHEQRFKRIDYAYDPISGNVEMVYFQLGKADAFYHQYEYDAENRIMGVKTSRDGIIWDEDASYKYYLHGPLARVEIGEHKVQGIDYAYTIQGWLKSINGGYEQQDMGDDLQKNNQYGEDAFGFSLQYFNGDYNPISTANNIAADHPASLANLYNGNIAAKSMHSQEMSIGKKYTYDQLNRLKNMDEYGMSNVSAIMWGAMKADGFRSAYEYDRNGNITDLQRIYNTTQANQTAENTLLDDMDYSYIAGTDRLDHVSDINPTAEVQNFQGQLAGNYEYDDIGNLTKDEKNKVDRIDWYPNGKIKRVIKDDPIATNPNLFFEYDALGNRIKKEVSFVEAGRFFVKTTYYVRDVQGNIMATYDEEDCRFIQGDEETGEVFYYQYSHDYGYYSTTVANEPATGLNGLTAYLNGTTYSKKTELCDQAALVLPSIANVRGLLLPHLVVADYLDIYPDAVGRVLNNKIDYFADALYTDDFNDFLGFVNENNEAWVEALKVDNNEQDFYNTFNDLWLNHYTSQQQLDESEDVFSMNREVANDLRVNNQAAFEAYFGINSTQFATANAAHTNPAQAAYNMRLLMIQIEDLLQQQDPNIDNLLNELNAIGMVITFANTIDLNSVTYYVDMSHFYNAQSWLPTATWNRLNNFLHQIRIFRVWNAMSPVLDLNSLTDYLPMNSMDWSQDANGDYLEHYLHKEVSAADIYNVSADYFTSYNMSNRDFYFENTTEAKGYVLDGIMNNASNSLIRSTVEAANHLASTEGALYLTEDLAHLSNYMKLEQPEEVLRLNYEHDALQTAMSSITNYSPIAYAEELESELGPFNFETPGDCSTNNTFLAAESYDIYGSSRLGVMDADPPRRSEATNTFERHLKEKTYELTDHLGNVVATVSDKKLHPQEVAGNGNVANVDPNLGFQADVTARYDRFPFGMEILERSKDYSVVDRDENLASLEYKGPAIKSCSEVNQVWTPTTGVEGLCTEATDPLYGQTYVSEVGLINNGTASNFFGLVRFWRPLSDYIPNIDANATYRFEIDVDKSRGRSTEVRFFEVGGRMHYQADISLSAGENASPQEINDADDKMARINFTGQQLIDAAALYGGKLLWETYFGYSYFNAPVYPDVLIKEVRVYKLIEHSSQPRAFRSSKPYRYGFQGQEVDNEWNGVAFGGGGIPVWEDEIEDDAVYTDDLADLSKWTIESTCAHAGSHNIILSTATPNCGAYTHSMFVEAGKEYRLTADLDFVSGSGGLVFDWEYYDPNTSTWENLKTQTFTNTGNATFDQRAIAPEAELRLRVYYGFGSGIMVSNIDNIELTEQLNKWTVATQVDGTTPAAMNEEGKMRVDMDQNGNIAISEELAVEDGEIYRLNFDYEWVTANPQTDVTLKVRRKNNGNGLWYDLLSVDLDRNALGTQSIELERTATKHYSNWRIEIEAQNYTAPIALKFDHFTLTKDHHEVAGGGTNGKVAFKYRVHDAAVGRFLSIDPLFKDYPYYSPYSFSGNRVIDAFELEGLEPVGYQYRFRGILELGGSAGLQLAAALDIFETIGFKIQGPTIEGSTEYYVEYLFTDEELRIGGGGESKNVEYGIAGTLFDLYGGEILKQSGIYKADELDEGVVTTKNVLFSEIKSINDKDDETTWKAEVSFGAEVRILLGVSFKISGELSYAPLNGTETEESTIDKTTTSREYFNEKIFDFGDTFQENEEE